MNECIIKLENIHKSFAGNEVVRGINLEVEQGEFLTLLGPSGCGKTTTLRMIAGFEDPNEGKIYISNEDMSSVPPYKRPVNTVFQSYALFPLMNVFDNVAYGLTVKKIPKDIISEKVMQSLKTVRLEGFEKRKIKQLSGGQRQRVAIARAIVNDPEVLLLDEPLGALDFKLRKQMQLELKQLQKELGITFIYVTHDQEEAMNMSDRIAIMNCGEIEQIDVPATIYSHPKTRFAADFIGESNIFEATLECDGSFSTEYGSVRANNDGCISGDKVYICVRPETVKVSEKPVPGFNIKGTVTDTICSGNIEKTYFDVGQCKPFMISRLTGTSCFAKGDTAYLYWDVESCGVMKK